jgi:hypothetical protein
VGARALSAVLNGSPGGTSAMSIATPDLLLRRADLHPHDSPNRKLPVLTRPR